MTGTSFLIGGRAGVRISLVVREPQPDPRFFAFFRRQLVGKHPMSKPVCYAPNQWRELNVFKTDGAVPIDNNEAKRDMKRIALARIFHRGLCREAMARRPCLL
jgi:hypothetical protein